MEQINFIFLNVLNYKQEPTKMFPNDDICNIKAAKKAARRIFQKYRIPQQKQASSEGLGHKQVSSLIKNAYDAINIPYDPSNQDVSAFMSVFGANQNSIIELDKLQQLAVKYLCGQQAFQNTAHHTNKIVEKSVSFSQPLKRQENQKMKTRKIQNFQNQTQYVKNQAQQHRNSSSSKQICRLQKPRLLKTNFLSPKGHSSTGQFFPRQDPVVKESDRQNQSKGQIIGSNSHRLSYDQVLNEAKNIFNEHRSRQKRGITINQAKQVLQKSYKLMGKHKFSPNEQDVRIWMKLCDIKKSGFVDWMNYEHFMKRLMERQNISQFQQK